MVLLADMYKRRELEFTEARKRMARMPVGATHIPNPVSTAPGFVIGNVYVMAGVPQVFQAMVDAVIPTLRSGTPVLSLAVSCPYGEGDIGTPLAAIQKAHPDTSIGSYPRYVGPEILDRDCRARPLARRHRCGSRRRRSDDRDHSM
jgi:molybdopterin-biosynthesis enzyme MoeA-like protein